MLSVSRINNYNLYTTNYYNYTSFQSDKIRKIPELTNLMQESISTYRNFYNRPTSIVNISNMSHDSIVMQDILPIGSPHLLLLYKDKFIYSLAEKADTLTFKNDFKNMFGILKKMYPEQNIIFFEHGSGNAKINGINSKINAGKSVTIAHGHFCVMPKGQESSFDKLLADTQQTLEQNDWKNIHRTTIKQDGLIPNLKEIFEEFGYTNSENYPPYLLISEFVTNSNKSKTALILQQNPNAKTPSQLFRKLISESVLKEDNQMFWNWKYFLSDLSSSNPSTYSKKRVNEIQNISDDLTNRLDILRFMRTDDSLMFSLHK